VATVTTELPCRRTPRGVGGAEILQGGSSLENLHAMVLGFSHDDAPVAVDGNAAMRLGKT